MTARPWLLPSSPALRLAVASGLSPTLLAGLQAALAPAVARGLCAYCPGLLPEGADPRALYCSRRCCRRAQAERANDAQSAARQAARSALWPCATPGCPEQFRQATHGRLRRFCPSCCAAREAQRAALRFPQLRQRRAAA